MHRERTAAGYGVIFCFSTTAHNGDGKPPLAYCCASLKKFKTAGRGRKIAPRTDPVAKGYSIGHKRIRHRLQKGTASVAKGYSIWSPNLTASVINRVQHRLHNGTASVTIGHKRVQHRSQKGTASVTEGHAMKAEPRGVHTQSVWLRARSVRKTTGAGAIQKRDKHASTSCSSPVSMLSATANDFSCASKPNDSGIGPVRKKFSTSVDFLAGERSATMGRFIFSRRRLCLVRWSLHCLPRIASRIATDSTDVIQCVPGSADTAAAVTTISTFQTHVPERDVTSSRTGRRRAKAGTACDTNGVWYEWRVVRMACCAAGSE